MSDQTKRKPLVLGTDMFNFIANIVSGTSENQENINNDSKGHKEVLSEQIPSTSTVRYASSESSTLAFQFHSDLNIDSCPESIEDSLRLNSKTTPLEEIPSEPEEFNFEFKNLSSATKEYANSNFLKGCKWSPDGTCIITNSNDSVLRIYDTTNEMMNDEGKHQVELPCCLRLIEPEIIYDFAWYPFMDSNNPTTACVFSSCKDNPVHLFDAYTGQIRCSYKGYNHLDELISAFCISFDSNCSKIYCGFNKCIKVFDISLPGRNYTDIETAKKGEGKLPGIVSCIEFSPLQSKMFAVGTYSKYIGIYSEETNEPVCLIESHTGGVTHLKFSKDGNRMFSGARKDSDIYCWDVRNLGKILQVYKRNVQTNQRIYFDLYSKYLCSGGTDGVVSLWNAEEFDVGGESEPILGSFKAHNDCVNGISFNPVYPLLATTSGQRKFFRPKTRKGDSSTSTSSASEDETVFTEENCLKIWKHRLV